MRYVLDINFILDAITDRSKYKKQNLAVLEHIIFYEDAYISSSSLQNIRFVLKKYYKNFYDKYLILEKNLKIAKTPSYCDYNDKTNKMDIEDYLVELSAKAIDAYIITTDKKFLETSTIAISPKEYMLNTISNNKKIDNIDFANLKKQYFLYKPEFEQEIDKVLNREIAKRYNLKVIVDGAQSFEATYKGKSEVHYCDIYTTSFFPAKPLGCFGDGGAVLTNNEELAQKIRSLRVHGQIKRYYHKYIGMNARMDTIQAAVLNVKLKHYPDDLKKRQEVAKKYSELLKNSDKITIPTVKSDRTSAWAQYSIKVKNRNKLRSKFKEAGIPTAIHYPMPLHLQKCFKDLEYKEGDFPMAEKVSKEILSLPMNPYLRDEEIKYVADTIKNAE